MAETFEFISTGGLADALDLTEATLRKYVRLGVLPAGRRVAGSAAFIWPVEELPLMRRAVAERRASLNRRVPEKKVVGVAA